MQPWFLNNGIRDPLAASWMEKFLWWDGLHAQNIDIIFKFNRLTEARRLSMWSLEMQENLRFDLLSSPSQLQTLNLPSCYARSLTTDEEELPVWSQRPKLAVKLEAATKGAHTSQVLAAPYPPPLPTTTVTGVVLYIPACEWEYFRIFLQLPHSAGLPGPGIRIIIMWRDKMMKEVVQIEGGWCSGAPYPTKGAWDLRSVFVTADWVLIWRLHSTTGVKQSSGRDNNMGDDFGFVQARRSIYFKNVCRESSTNRRSRHTKR